jgi:hypothetical protein
VRPLVVLGMRVGTLPVAARIPPESGKSLRQARRRFICRKGSLKIVDVHRSIDTCPREVPFWNKGFAGDSLLRGIPLRFFEECASLWLCVGCESAENDSVELTDKVGDASGDCSNWGAYFIEEYSVKITWLSIVILG